MHLNILATSSMLSSDLLCHRNFSNLVPCELSVILWVLQTRLNECVKSSHQFDGGIQTAPRARAMGLLLFFLTHTIAFDTRLLYDPTSKNKAMFVCVCAYVRL